jgi:hypothetical protein
MAAYAVFEAPAHDGSPVHPADRFVFVRDGFSFGAFLLGPLWMLWRRLWLVLLIYVLVIAALELAIWWLGIGSIARTTVNLLIAFLIGIEAATLRRWTLLRRGWRDRGIVIASDRELAERRFFDVTSAREVTGRPVAGGASGPLSASYRPVGSDVVGLFPEPGGGG